MYGTSPAEEATAAEIQASIPDSPSYSAVRALIKKLCDKGHVAFRQDGARHVYRPVLPKADAKRSAVRRLVDTFFDGSLEKAVAAQLSGAGSKPSESELKEIEKLIREARKEQKDG